MAFKVFDYFADLMRDFVLPVTMAEMKLARSLAERYAALSPRDCVHLGVMKLAGVGAILTADQGFAVVDGIKFLNLSNY